MAAKLVAVCAVATSALAEPYYGYGGYSVGYGNGRAAHPYGASSYTYRSPQGLGKRSADAEPEADAYGYGYPAYGYRAYGYGPGIASHYGGGSSYVARSPQGLGKRSADAEPEADAEAYGYGYPAYGYRAYGYGPGIASHYGGGSSYVARSPQGLGKRSADADADAFYAYAGYSPRVYGYGPGIAAHYGGGSSYVARSPQGLGKRSADADADAYYGYGYPSYSYGGYYGYGGARSYEYRSPQGLRGKRDAEPFGYYGPASRSYQQVTRSNGYYADPSSYRVESNGYSAGVYENNFNGFNRGKRSAEPSGYYGYGSGSYQNVNRYDYGNTNSYSVATNGYAGQVRENNNGYRGAYAYGFVNGK